MATDPTTTSDPALGTVAEPASALREKPPQFGLRALFVGVALCSALFAVVSVIDAIWSLVLIWSLLLVLGHVLANAWGSQAFGHDLRPEASDAAPVRPARPAVALTGADPASIRLRHPARIGRGRIAASIVGAIGLGIVGGAVLAMLHKSQANWAALVVWVCSSAVIGGFFGFIASGLFEVFTMPVGTSGEHPRTRDRLRGV